MSNQETAAERLLRETSRKELGGYGGPQGAAPLLPTTPTPQSVVPPDRQQRRALYENAAEEPED
jgi:hypothetical protein